jgi:hypothetical protein
VSRSLLIYVAHLCELQGQRVLAGRQPKCHEVPARGSPIYSPAAQSVSARAARLTYLIFATSLDAHVASVALMALMDNKHREPAAGLGAG